jgi:hypothetical protein
LQVGIAGTKLPLWNIAWREFLEMDLQKLKLFTSTNCNDTTLVKTASGRMFFASQINASVNMVESIMELRK